MAGDDWLSDRDRKGQARAEARRTAALSKPPRRANCYQQSLLANHNRRGWHLSPNGAISGLSA
jgi:hypothetical protein